VLLAPDQLSALLPHAPGPLPILAVLLPALTSFVLVSVAAFIVIALLVSHTRFQFLAASADEADAALDRRERFRLQVADRLRVRGRAAKEFVLILIAVPRPETAGDASGEETDASRLRALGRAISRHFRREDFSAPYDECHWGLLLDAERAAVEPICIRLADAWRRAPAGEANGGHGIPSVGIGAATHPHNGKQADALIRTAQEAAERALRTRAIEWFVAPGEEVGASEAGRPPPPSPQERRGEGRWLDPVTGVLHPDRLPYVLQKFVARFRREGEPVSVLYVQVDSAARYEERYRAPQLDGLLQGLADVLQRDLRRDDIVARSARFSFAVAAGCGGEDALSVARRLTEGVKRKVFSVGPQGLKLTVSVGVAAYPDHGGSPRVLLEAARAAAEAAARQGKSTCLLYDAGRHGTAADAGPVDRL